MEWSTEEPNLEKVGSLYALLKGSLSLTHFLPRQPLDRNH